MSRRKLPATREARRTRNKEKREAGVREFYSKFGLHPSAATPARLAMMDRVKNKRDWRLKEAQEVFEAVLSQAKLLSITAEDFEYCNLAPRSKETLERFNKDLRRQLAQFEGSDEPEQVVDTHIRDFMQIWIENGELIPSPPRIGAVPKARKYVSGKVEMLRVGEPDTDVMLENIE